jgi:hypothetical protein
MFLPLSLPAWRHNEVVPKEKLAHAAVHDGVVASLAPLRGSKLISF